MNHWLELRGTVWVMCDGIGCQPASDAEIEMWQELAKLRAECDQWREELRIYRETENKRIAELEQSVTVRDTEIARLETDLELARIGARRYETARRMGAHQWGDAHSLNLLTGKPLDQIIDELRPFMFPQEARAGNGGVA